MEFYNCLAIEPDSKSRLLLKQAMSLVTQFNDVKLVRNDRVALEYLKNGENYDLIFISDSFDKTKISQFIKKAKETDIGSFAGYVLLSSAQNDTRSIAKSLLEGIDGVLILPYSIDSLQELSLLAAKVRQLKEEEKRKNALRFLTSNVIYSVDIMAQACMLKHSFNSVKKVIAKVNESVLSFDSSGILETYLEILATSFMKIQKPVKVVQECRYRGTSERVRNIAMKDAINNLEDKINKLEKDIEEKGIVL